MAIGNRPDPAHRVRPPPVRARSVPDIVFSIDPDNAYTLADKFRMRAQRDDVLTWHCPMYRRVDWLGAVLATAVLTFIVFVLSDGSTTRNEGKTGCTCTREREPATLLPMSPSPRARSAAWILCHSYQVGSRLVLVAVPLPRYTDLSGNACSQQRRILRRTYVGLPVGRLARAGFKMFAPN